MTAFKSFMRILAAGLLALAATLAPKLLEWVHGPAPKDISAGVWLIAGTVVAWLINYGVGKIKQPASAEPPSGPSPSARYQ